MDFNAFNGGGAPASMGASSNGGVVSLSKGQKVSLSKMAPSLKKCLIGLGWDTNRYSGGYDFDLDASVFLCDANGRAQPNNFIFYNNLIGPNGSVQHMGDNLTGEGEGDDEQIKIDLDLIPDYISKIAITVTIHEADIRRQNFGLVENSYIRLVDDTNGKEVLRFNLGEDFSVETALVVAEIYRKDNGWSFNAIGSGFSGGLKALCANYGIQAE